jgi:dephospho-CoA kinase
MGRFPLIDEARTGASGESRRGFEPDASEQSATSGESRKRAVIGLTGPMCAGKNRAAGILEKRGFVVADADKVAHQALHDVRAEVIAAFEEIARERNLVISNPDGSINRRALAEIVFSDPTLLAKHESIVYPRINLLLNNVIEDHPDQTVVINAPLLHKSPILNRCDFVIFVASWAPIRFFRALRRDRLPPKQVFARFFAQKNLFSQYILKNVDIQRVLNIGSVRALEKRLEKLLLSRGY